MFEPIFFFLKYSLVPVYEEKKIVHAIWINHLNKAFFKKKYVVSRRSEQIPTLIFPKLFDLGSDFVVLLLLEGWCSKERGKYLPFYIYFRVTQLFILISNYRTARINWLDVAHPASFTSTAFELPRRLAKVAQRRTNNTIHIGSSTVRLYSFLCYEALHWLSSTSHK